MLRKDRLKPASKGEPSLLVLTLPANVTLLQEELDVFALPLEFRRGGMLLVMPSQVLSDQVLHDGLSGSEEVIFGPNTNFQVSLMEENEDDLSLQDLGVSADAVVVDVTDDVIDFCREYDPVTDSQAAIHGFSFDFPTSLPDYNVLLGQVREWISSRHDDRSGFYTAQEDQAEPPLTRPAKSATPKKAPVKQRVTNSMISDQLATLAAQMQVLSQRQDQLEKSKGGSAADVGGQAHGHSFLATSKMPAVSAALPNPSGVSQTQAAKALGLLSPPPKISRNPPAEPNVDFATMDEPLDILQPRPEEAGGIATALAQQSTAITALVAHLAAQAPDALGDLAALGPSSSSTKGVSRRERMQNDLAADTSTYHLQMMQQLHRRLHPAKPVPQKEEDLRDLSVLTYLERNGGYRNQREMGLVAWILGHALDAAASGNMRRTKEVLALMMVAVEQAVVDRGDWSLAYMLTLLEEPPNQMFQDRAINLVHHSKPFGPLVPPQWTAVCLAYLKDLEVLASKKGETAKKPPKAAASSSSETPAQGEPEKEASPRRKPRFPKKPKASPQDA
eukprot:s1015_g10.t1